MDVPEASTSDADQHEKERVNNNSLNTLDSALYEATIPAQPGTPCIRPLEMRDVVLWQLEEAQRLGEVGLTTNFPDPSEIFKPFPIDPSSELEPQAEDHASLNATMQENHKEIMQAEQRKILMDQAGPLLESTETDVNQMLLAEGIPEQELQDKSLRQKIVQLVELKEPPPEANFVAVSVFVASETEGVNHMLGVKLPLKADVAEVYALLDEVVKALLLAKGFSYEPGGTWKYQLIDQSRSQVLMDKSMPLETDLDYKTMLQQVSKVDEGKAPKLVLTQDGLAKPIATSEDNPEMPEQDPYDLNEVLDENGEPYFQPLDFERVIKKYADFGLDPREDSKFSDSDDEAQLNH